MTAEAEKALAEIVAGLENARGCFDAAVFEGWFDALGSDDIDRICDLWDRRIRFAYEAILRALTDGRLIADGFTALKAELDEARQERAMWFGIAQEKTELADRSVQRLVEATVPGSTGAFSSRDSWKARAEAAETALATARSELDRLAGLEAESMEAGEVVGDLRAELATAKARIAELEGSEGRDG